MPDAALQYLALPLQVNFDVKDPSFKLDDLLKLELHKFEEEVGEIVDRAQKEEKMEQALIKLKDTWGRVEFQFHQFKDTPVSVQGKESVVVHTVRAMMLLCRNACMQEPQLQIADL